MEDKTPEATSAEISFCLRILEDIHARLSLNVSKPNPSTPQPLNPSMSQPLNASTLLDFIPYTLLNGCEVIELLDLQSTRISSISSSLKKMKFNVYSMEKQLESDSFLFSQLQEAKASKFALTSALTRALQTSLNSDQPHLIAQLDRATSENERLQREVRSLMDEQEKLVEQRAQLSIKAGELRAQKEAVMWEKQFDAKAFVAEKLEAEMRVRQLEERAKALETQIETHKENIFFLKRKTTQPLNASTPQPLNPSTVQQLSLKEKRAELESTQQFLFAKTATLRDLQAKLANASTSQPLSPRIDLSQKLTLATEELTLLQSALSSKQDCLLSQLNSPLPPPIEVAETHRFLDPLIARLTRLQEADLEYLRSIYNAKLCSLNGAISALRNQISSMKAVEVKGRDLPYREETKLGGENSLGGMLTFLGERVEVLARLGALEAELDWRRKEFREKESERLELEQKSRILAEEKRKLEKSLVDLGEKLENFERKTNEAVEDQTQIHLELESLAQDLDRKRFERGKKVKRLAELRAICLELVEQRMELGELVRKMKSGEKNGGEDLAL